MNPIRMLLANGGAAKAGRGVERASVPTALYLIIYMLWDRMGELGPKLDSILALLISHHGG